ncbi:MAG: methyltransferase domain-containing protein [Candidatus Sumerlaeota bacterium]|nr:methyltransferase domain-containing protein [Candidatus Sumerlaeota bacterium]
MHMQRDCRPIRAMLVGILMEALALSAGHAQSANETPEAAQARAILEAAGVQGGVVVHLGCGDGKLTAALHANDRYLVHGLDADAKTIETARRNIQALGLYGKVSVEQWTGKRLPYAENLVNLLVAEDLGGVPMDEVMRVLAPLGVAYIKTNDAWLKTVKPWPKDIDQWTHFLHGPDNNAVAQDTVVAAPRSIQWVADPKWGRSHEELASMSAAVTANGRVFFVADEAPLDSIRFTGQWSLIARDAFNGVLLWKKEIPVWTDHLRQFRSGPADLPRRLVAVGDVVYVTLGLAAPVTALNAATGDVIRVYAGTEYTEEILADGGVLYLAVGTSEANRTGGGLVARGEPAPSGFRYLTAIRADTGERLWTLKRPPERGRH